MNLLVQTQLSNYNTAGKFILEADSGWQMIMGRVRTLLALQPNIRVSILCPLRNQLVTQPENVNPDIIDDSRVKCLYHEIIPNALATRYDFDFDGIGKMLKDTNERYTHVYINDPMHLRNFRALFYLKMQYTPRFFVHSHFIDNPECPKFPMEASLWYGQLEAALKADYNFWQCESAMNLFLDSARNYLNDELVNQIKNKSIPWDDGYSYNEILKPIDESGVRFKIPNDKVIVFVPNRVGGKGRSSDYTNCGKFLFEICNELWKERQDFIVIAGNPSQKFSNDELNELCNPYAKLFEGTLTRNEYRWVGRNSHISVGLYDQDSYGGTAARELLELGCLPVWINRYEYKSLADATGYPFIAAELDNIKNVLSDVIDYAKKDLKFSKALGGGIMFNDAWSLRDLNREKCSYEMSTQRALDIMKDVANV
jgi:hypothetical protein